MTDVLNRDLNDYLMGYDYPSNSFLNNPYNRN